MWNTYAEPSKYVWKKRNGKKFGRETYQIFNISCSDVVKTGPSKGEEKYMMDVYRIHFDHSRSQHIQRYLDESSICTVGAPISSRFLVAPDGPKVPYDPSSMPD